MLTTCTDDGLNPLRPGNAVGGPHRTNGRASALQGAGKKVKFDVCHHLTHTVSESEPVRGAAAPSHGNAVVGPDGAKGRAVARPGSRGERVGAPPSPGGRPTAGVDPSSASRTSLSLTICPPTPQQAFRDIGARTFAVQIRRNYGHDNLRHQCWS